MTRAAAPVQTDHAAAVTPADAVILNALPHAVLIMDKDGAVTDANSAAEAFFHTGISVLQRSRLDELVAFGSPLLALVDQVRRTYVSINEYNVDLGTPRTQNAQRVDVYAAPLPELEDRFIVILQKRSMAQMIERQLTHQAAARSVSGLASMLAHEIKNPLSGIRGAAQLLEMNQDDDGRAWTRLICTETDRIRDLVDRMEVFGDERPFPKEPVNIHSVLDHVRRLAQSGFAEHLSVEEIYDPSLPPLSGDRDHLIQALLNLAKNAAEAIGPDRKDGRLVFTSGFRPGVHLTMPGTRTRVGLPLQITVEDNGPGIPDDVREHLFDPFVTTKSSGSGLGLALVAKIVRDHGGVIECDSQPGKTVFRILLPLHKPDGNGHDADAEIGGA
ncbi:MAG: two-component system sensor histidine kinase NtrB [Hyphomicrobiaceae bacterium]